MIRVITCLLLCFMLVLPAAADRPNVLLITADDMNWDSLGCFGSPVQGVSPNLDKLASQGVRFEQAYVTIAICQPCRASIMTGRYPHTSGALGFDKINKDVPTMPEALKAAGYYSACIGKAVHTIKTRHKTAFDETYDMADLGYGRSHQRYRETTAGAIAKAKAQDKPFFLNVNLHDPHRPFANAPQENREKRPKAWKGVPLVENPYKPDEVPLPGFLPDLPEIRIEMAEYYTSVRRCDEIIGEVLKVLDESGQADNTVVMFLSDHGIAVPFAKTNCWMHSNRTPLIVKWPGKSKAGSTVSEKMVSSIDLAPTILDIAGLENLDGANGESFRGLIDPDVSADGVGRDHVFVHLNAPYSKKPFPMRGVITPKGGYIWNGWADGKTTFRNESMSGRTFKAMQKAAETDPAIAARVKHLLYRVPEESYNYQKDPDALNNLVPVPIDKEYASLSQFVLLKHMRDTKDPQFQAYRDYLASFEAQSLQYFEPAQTPKD
jgi:N-sulfoglucosamine sulfohydrolase